MADNNNLKELNDILFDTLRGVSEGTVDEKRAHAVTGLSSTIINGAKVQIQAMKLNGSKGGNNFLGLPESTQKFQDKHEAMTAYAKEVGFKTIAEALVEMGKDKFTEGFDSWKESIGAEFKKKED